MFCSVALIGNRDAHFVVGRWVQLSKAPTAGWGETKAYLNGLALAMVQGCL